MGLVSSGRVWCGALLLISLVGCAGKPAAEALLDTGHGGMEQLLPLMEQRGVPCKDAMPVEPPPGTEQAVRCTVSTTGEQVLIVHFLNDASADAFADEAERDDAPGIYTPTWALRASTDRTAETVRDALTR